MSLRNYYILNRIYYLKLDVSDDISIKKAPVWLVLRGAVMYYRKCYTEIAYQYKTRGCQKKKSLMPPMLHGTYQKANVCL